MYVPSIDEADFIYASISQVYGKQKALLPKELQKFLVVSNMRSQGELVSNACLTDLFLSERAICFSGPHC
jgi:hypothetical protein